jgi:hypothetical protein
MAVFGKVGVILVLDAKRKSNENVFQDKPDDRTDQCWQSFFQYHSP